MSIHTSLRLIFGGLSITALCILFGCNVTLPKLPDPPITTTPTTTTTTTTTQPPKGPAYTKDFDWADAEKDNSAYCGGVEIRCLVNDNLMQDNAWITGLSERNGGMSLKANADGSVTLTGKDFETSRNSYHFEGWKIRTDQSKLVPDSTITLKGEQKGGTTRGYWRTVQRFPLSVLEPAKPTAVSANVPNIEDDGKYSSLGRKPGGRLAQPGEFHGYRIFGPGKAAVNYKYNLRGYFEHELGVACGSQKGQVSIGNDATSCTWRVVE